MKISRRKVCSIFSFSQVFYIKIVESEGERKREKEKRDGHVLREQRE